MLKLICLGFLLLSVQGHTSDLQDDASIQSSLIPQELNPEIITQKDQPWKAVMPLMRTRREVSVETATPVSLLETVKGYSRIIAGVVLVISSIIEIVLYIIEFYQS